MTAAAHVPRDDLSVTARRHRALGSSAYQSIVLGYAELIGSPLDVCVADDAALNEILISLGSEDVRLQKPGAETFVESDLLKSVLVAMPALLGLQGVALAARSAATLLRREPGA